MCQVCVRDLYDTRNHYTTRDLSVHHIYSLAERYDLRLEDTNLITLCRYHHELADDGRIPSDVLARLAAEQEEKAGTSSVTCVAVL